MPHRIQELFDDNELVEKIQHRLPHLFHYAERDCSRGGKVGMEVGSWRERILVSLLIVRFGKENVETGFRITEHEVDVKIFGEPVSIKTLTTTSPRIGAVKAIWTVEAQQSQEFVRHFRPRVDYWVVHIVWEDTGGMYYIPVEAQDEVFRALGRDGYLKLPKGGRIREDSKSRQKP